MTYKGIKITKRSNGSYQVHYHRDGIRKRPVRKTLAGDWLARHADT